MLSNDYPGSIMTTWRLYLLVLFSVLVLVGCGPDRSNQAEETTDTPPPAEAPAEHAPEAEAEEAVDEAIDESAAEEAAVHVLVIGNSIAAGYGLDPDESFPARLQERADDQGWDVHITNAGLSGDTTAGGLNRLPWLLQTPVDIVVLELGGNDGLRGIDPQTTRSNLMAMVDTTQARYPNAQVLLAGMQVPPNMGQEYADAFRDVFPDVANAHDAVTLIPFVLDGVGGEPDLNQADGIHPTAEGQRIVADNVWEYLAPMLESNLNQPETG